MKSLPTSQILKLINTDMGLQSLLYDLDLLPEQFKRKTREWAIMCVIVALWSEMPKGPSKRKEKA